MKLRRHLVPSVVLLAVPSILYAPFLVGGKVLYWGVYLLQFYPWRQLAVDQIRAGQWPLWNPYLGAGTPLAANLQTAAFYPPNVIFLWMPVEQAFAWGLWLHIALAGLSAYYLGRASSLGRFGALVCGLAYGAGGYLVARWLFPSMVYAAAWLPLMLALAEQTLRARGQRYRRLVAPCVLAVVIGLQLLAGHAQTSFYSLLIVAAFSLVRLVQSERDTGAGRLGHTLPAVGSLLLAVLGGIALAAIQLLPTAEFAAHSQRAGTLTDLEFAYGLSFWPWRLLTLLAPDFFGNPAQGGYWARGTYWEETAYIGILPLLLAVHAIAGWWHKRRRDSTCGTAFRMVPFWGLLALISLVLALGENTPIYRFVFEYVPGFGLFQAPARLMIGYAIGLSMLAGIGADGLRVGARGRVVLRFALLIGLGMGLAAAVARLFVPGVPPSFGNSTARLGMTLALSAGLLLIRGRQLQGRHWEMAAITLIVADLLIFGWPLAPGTDAQVYHRPVSTARFLETQPPGRVFAVYPYARTVYDAHVSLQAYGSTDPDDMQSLRESQIPNLNAVHGLYGVGNYDPLTIGLYRDLWDRLEGERDKPPALEETLPILNLFGARYILSDTVTSLTSLVPIYDAGPYILQNAAALPEAFVVPTARIVEDHQARLEILTDPAFDPSAEVVLSQVPAQSLSDPVSPAKESPMPIPSVERTRADQVTVRVDMKQLGYLVLADTYYPGWRAEVDGTETEILAANHAFRAVALEPGEHTVVFRYAPISFRLGAWITLGVWLVLFACLAATSMYRWRRKGATPDYAG